MRHLLLLLILAALSPVPLPAQERAAEPQAGPAVEGAAGAGQAPMGEVPAAPDAAPAASEPAPAAGEPEAGEPTDPGAAVAPAAQPQEDTPQEGGAEPAGTERPAAEPAPPAGSPATPEPAAEPDPGEARVVGPSDDPDAAEGSSTRVPLAEIRRYVAVFNAIREAYVEPVDDRELMQSAIRGLLLDLDPHSAYLEGDAAEAFDESTSGAYAGIGVEVLQLPEGSLRVVAPIDDTPAERAGIRSGDTIVAADGVTFTPSSHDGAGPLRGEPGTSVVLTVLREGAAEPLEIPVERQIIRVASVRGRMLEPGYAYIRIAAFQVDTAAEFQRTLRELQADGPLRGLVMDLRSNPGGLLTSAVQIADDLLDAGAIVSTRGRISISDAEFSATPGDLLDGAPVVVIVDAGSASASEVLAGALHDNGRARIVGSRTFGKGSVQTVLPLDNGDSVKLTTARYYTPSGRSIQARGIDPDVVLEAEDRPARLAGEYSEAALPGHLRGDEEALPGDNAGEVLDGDGPIDAALAELKHPTPGPQPKAAPSVANASR
ncbi:S41 family peptidase [Luteimonas sp. RD2P54]|uniref:S41 family peptidase n=1 Tax=Luteimonas endophytica TaxID=3042023 RepID=A0ABT6JCL5_9GAMM|nr:S41 family peptidase [Luteimonas endophytica]MDH5824553.1 S41 family peptidase [Luteimonas endophytica]